MRKVRVPEGSSSFSAYQVFFASIFLPSRFRVLFKASIFGFMQGLQLDSLHLILSKPPQLYDPVVHVRGQICP